VTNPIGSDSEMITVTVTGIYLFVYTQIFHCLGTHNYFQND